MDRSALPACLYVNQVQTWKLQGPEEDIGSPGPGVTDDCKPSRGCWDSNLCPLQEQSVLLEPSLQKPHLSAFFKLARNILVVLISEGFENILKMRGKQSVNSVYKNPVWV